MVKSPELLRVKPTLRLNLQPQMHTDYKEGNAGIQSAFGKAQDKTIAYTPCFSIVTES